MYLPLRKLVSMVADVDSTPCNQPCQEAGFKGLLAPGLLLAITAPDWSLCHARGTHLWKAELLVDELVASHEGDAQLSGYHPAARLNAHIVPLTCAPQVCCEGNMSRGCLGMLSALQQKGTH